MTTLLDISEVLRSKNADPFITTCDIFVRSAEDYAWLKRSGLLTAETVAELYRMPFEAVIGVFFVDGIQAVKVSFFKTAGGRYIASGDLEDVDATGSQQHVPLLRIEVPSKRS
ncbi:MAG: hypothetical protein QOK05_2025 [Chloroflexota bacterium]|jgi:hypothetical protein|nr:hypothetical protein [Chloroflexota bacterium]